jgi:hypothetical protein
MGIMGKAVVFAGHGFAAGLTFLSVIKELDLV